MSDGMGGTGGKLRKYLQNGDECSSLKFIETHKQFLTNFDANQAIAQHSESALHLAAKCAMRSLLAILLFESNGNPYKRNEIHRNVLHLICQTPTAIGDSFSPKQTRVDSDSDSVNYAMERRSKCLELVLEWTEKNKDNENSEDLDIDVNALDDSGCSALHYAAASGLVKCVQMLVDYECHVYIENNNGDTACDLAAKFNHNQIVRYLEFKTVFANDISKVDESRYSDIVKEGYIGLRAQDLQEAKCRLISETSDMLNVTASEAEALLRCFHWSPSALLESWISDSQRCYTKAGLSDQFSFVDDKGFTSKHIELNAIFESHYSPRDNEIIANKSTENEIKRSDDQMESICKICYFEIDAKETPLHLQCEHQFCLNCWKTYIELKIESGERNLTCPAFDCSHLITIDIEKIISPQLKHRFNQYDIEAFIESHPNIKWCPSPGCNKVVYMPEWNVPENKCKALVEQNIQLPPISHAVSCENYHYFCWECGVTPAHAPIHCKLWEEWIIKISDVKPDQLNQTNSKSEDAANYLWLIRNTKQCPRCKTYISKSDGCNHIRCGKCKHDFCWVCLEAWKKHSSATGGYFRCNRSEAARRVERSADLMKKMAETKNCEMQELKRFVHHYTKYKFNESAYQTESTLLESSKKKQNDLRDYYLEFIKTDSDHSSIICDDFLYNATLELIRARLVLCGSAIYGYYLTDYGYNKTIFEYMEDELNFTCNCLSDIILFDYLRASRLRIMDLTFKVKSKRLDFLSAIANGLIPPETPLSLKRHYSKRHLPSVLGLDPIHHIYINPCDPCDEEDMITRAIIASLDELDMNNAWVQDRSGRHNNLAAIYDWPDNCEDQHHTDNGNASDKHILSKKAESSGNDESICQNPVCDELKVKNPRTGKMHDFCSLRCKFATQSGDKFEDNDEIRYEYDSSMDLLIAIEMSKITALEEEEKRKQLLQNNGKQSVGLNLSEDIFNSFLINLNIKSQNVCPFTKIAIMFFLKKSINDELDLKNLNLDVNNAKIKKELFNNC